MDRPVAVYKRIAEDLKRRINSRELTGKLPGQRELAEEYAVNVITLRNAIKAIEEDGLIDRRQSKGFFIRRLNSGIERKRMVGLILATNGHLYSELTGLLVTGFQAQDYFPIVIDTMRHHLDEKQFLRQVEQLIGSDPAAIVVDGHKEFPFELFRKNRKYIENLTLVLRDEHDFGDALRVLPDERLGGETGALHLKSAGRKRILLLMPPKSSLLLSGAAERALAGAVEALKREGYAEGTSFKTHVVEEPDGMELPGLLQDKTLPELLKEWRPDAVFAFADYLMQPVYAYAKKAGLKIPDDLALLGYYDTSWCSAYPVPLSSISIEIGKMAQVAVDMTVKNIGLSIKSSKTVRIPPQLAARESTGAANMEFTMQSCIP